MALGYNADRIRRFYDDFREREWERLDDNPRSRAIFHVHRWYLQQFIEPHHHVLDAGAGPGRFSIEFAKIGATVTIGDISPRQLDISRHKLREADLESHIADRVLLDIVDCSQFPDESFDDVVCYGSPISYVQERADEALGELLRVTKSGGHLFLSVCARLNVYLPLLVGWVRDDGIEAVQRYLDTGNPDDIDDPGHPMRCYKWSELKALINRHPAEIVAVSASNCMATIPAIPSLKEIEQDPLFWKAFLKWEVEICREPGVLDTGSHIIAVVRRL